MRKVKFERLPFANKIDNCLKANHKYQSKLLHKLINNMVQMEIIQNYSRS